MGRPVKDLTGMMFGRLKVICRAEDYIKPDGRHSVQWLCECSCGNTPPFPVLAYNLTKENGTKSCGCLQKEVAAATLAERQKKYNKYDIDGQYGVGWTSNTNAEFYFDLEDYDKIKEYCWCEHVDDTGYHSLTAWDSKLKKIIKMHFVIMHKYCDHKNRNPLDNRKENLRTATKYENAQNKGISKRNTSGVIGVKWHKQKHAWEVTIGVNGKHLYLGRYIDKNLAIHTRLEAEAKYFKEFAPQKHLFNKYNISVYKEDGANE
jgi:hypothetical protein